MLKFAPVSPDGEVLVFLLVAADVIKLGIEKGTDIVSSVGSPEYLKISSLMVNLILYHLK